MILSVFTALGVPSMFTLGYLRLAQRSLCYQMNLHEFPVSAVLILLEINDYTGRFDQEKLVLYFQILVMSILHHKNKHFV